jgi:hypothetical protein
MTQASKAALVGGIFALAGVLILAFGSGPSTDKLGFGLLLISFVAEVFALRMRHAAN